MLTALRGPDTTTKAAAMLAAETDQRVRALLKLSDETGWPLAFEDDLYVHDVEYLRAHPTDEFIYILEDTGTHLYSLQHLHVLPAGAKQWARTSIEWHSGESKLNFYGPNNPRPRFFHLRGARLREITWQRAMELVTEA